MEPKQIFRELKLPLPQNLPQAVKNLLEGCLQKDGKTRPAFTGIQESFEEKVKKEIENIKEEEWKQLADQWKKYATQELEKMKDSVKGNQLLR
ncbi:unnamed protein product [Enterobius vermicularis]|uniref:Protein kinase domain-containing protein n=1 Tax=Enterobius vermicularis TaxID=51028 RepID=A0A0N4UTL9_ENTVE|nr:unnamed protein product [Enterobius vermicularis]